VDPRTNETLNDNTERDPRLFAIPDTHGHAKGEHKPYAEERPLPLTARMLFLWFYHACRRGYPRFLMVADHMNYLTFEDPAAVNLVRRALKLAQAGDLYGAAETASVEVGHAAVVSEGLRRGMRYSIGAEVDNDPRSRPDAQNIVDAMRPDAIIRSVHFVPITHPVHGENWPWPFDNPEFAELHESVGTDALWDTYVNLLVDAIERLPGHIVGHFFAPAVFGQWPDDAKLAAYEDRVLAAAAARQMAVEFNTRFLYRDHPDEEKRRYLDANRRFLRKAKERGVGIAIGSDAHSPKDQAGAFDIVLDVLDELEINEIVFPLGGQLRRVALRVVREPEPVPEPPPPPEPVRVARESAEPAAKPVRKARATAKPGRSAEASAERPPERAEPSAPPPAGAENAKKPARKSAPKPAAEAKPAPEAQPAAEAKPVAEAKPAAKPATPKPTVPKPVAAKLAVVKPVAAKSVVAKPPETKTPAVKSAPAKIATKPPAKPTPKPISKPVAKPAVKAVAKPVAKPAAKVAAKTKPAPAKRNASLVAGKGRAKAAPPKAVKKAAAPSRAVVVKKVAPKRHAPKKATPVRPAAKKSAPAKKKRPPKAAAKKATPARKVPARGAVAAKKTTGKKTAPKRR
jgi:HisJ family histidinol phosphate phosphatase